LSNSKNEILTNGFQQSGEIALRPALFYIQVKRKVVPVFNEILRHYDVSLP